MPRFLATLMLGGILIAAPHDGQTQLLTKIPYENTCSEFTLYGPTTIAPIIPEDKFVPDFTLEGLSITDLSEPVMVLNFFAASSSKFIAENEVLLTLKKKYNVPIYGVALYGNKNTLKEFLKTHGNPFIKAGVDTHADLYGTMGMEDLTQTLIITKDHKVHWMYTDILTQEIMESSMMSMIRDLQANSARAEAAP